MKGGLVSDNNSSRRLPDRPSLRHLQEQAKDLLEAGTADTLALTGGAAFWLPLRHVYFVKRH